MDTSPLTRYIRSALLGGSLPTLPKMIDFLYRPDEGEHVQYVSLMGELRILHNGMLFADFDLYNPSGKLYRLDMWHAGGWEITFNLSHEIESVRFYHKPQHIDYPHAYRFNAAAIPLMLVGYTGMGFNDEHVVNSPF